jgi:hypothetical protein
LRKEWVATAIGVAGSLLSSYLGGQAASSAARAAERRQRAQEAKDDAWYRRRYNEDYADTAAGQNLIRRAEQFNKKNWRRAAGAQAVAGGTDAATQMQKDAGNQMMAETLANVAATDQHRKEQVDNIHRQQEAQYAQMDMQREMNRAQSVSNAASAASNAIMQGASAFENGTSLKGGSNQSAPVTRSEVTVTDGGNGPTVQVNDLKPQNIEIGGKIFTGTENYKAPRYDR